MTTQSRGRVSVTRRIGAPATAIFSMLTDPAQHVAIDGSGMVRQALTTGAISTVGDEFVMAMHAEWGDYEMVNEVTEFEPNRRLAWEPRPHREGGEADKGNYVWSYELERVDDTTTDVTETFDCTRSPEWLRERTHEGENWVEAMTISLENLESCVAAPVT